MPQWHRLRNLTNNTRRLQAGEVVVRKTTADGDRTSQGRVVYTTNARGGKDSQRREEMTARSGERVKWGSDDDCYRRLLRGSSWRHVGREEVDLDGATLLAANVHLNEARDRW